MTDALSPERRKAAVRILFITIFLDLLGFGIIIPQTPFYATACGVGGTVIGLIAGTYSLLQFLMAPFWGRVSDRIGRRPVILIGLAGAGVSYMIFGASFRLAALTGLSPILFLVVSRALAGFFNANISAAQAYMADITPGADRTAAMGVVGAAIALGFVLGPAISAGIWVLTGSAELPFYAAAAFELICLQWAWRALPETHAPGQAAGSAAPARRLALASLPAGPLRLLLLTGALSTFAFAGMENTIGLFVMDSPALRYDNLQFALLVLYLGLVIVLTQGLAVKPLSERLRETRMLGLGSLAMILGLALTPAATSSIELYLLMGVLCFGYGLVSPSLSSLNSRLAPEAVRGEVLGLGQSMTSLGRILGPVVGGWLYQTVSHGSTYLLGGALSTACMVLALVLDLRIESAARESP